MIYWFTAFTGLKDIIIQDDQKIINRILYGINDFNKRGDVINIISLKFSVPTCENLKQKEESKSSKTAINLFHLLKEFGKLQNVKEEVIINLVDDQLQDTSELFQLYFHENLSLSLSKSKIIKEKQPNKKSNRNFSE